MELRCSSVICRGRRLGTRFDSLGSNPGTGGELIDVYGFMLWMPGLEPRVIVGKILKVAVLWGVKLVSHVHFDLHVRQVAFHLYRKQCALYGGK